MLRLMVAIALVGMVASASAQKTGGVLKRANDENPPSASIHEEGSNIVTTPFIPVFNNLVDFDPTKSLSRTDSIVPDLATSFAALPYCRRPYVKGYVPSMNSQYSNLRLEDVWLDK